LRWQDELQVNAQPHPSPEDAVLHAKAAAATVWVAATAIGPPVTQVKQSTATSNNLYWMYYSNSKLIHALVFQVTFKAGSPLHNQSHVFLFPNGYAGNITTPFGVPFWSGDPILGPAVLTVEADNQPAGTYNFTVVA